MGSLSIWHWLIVLVVVLVIFGTKRLRNVGQDLGEAIKGFKKGMQDGEDDDKSHDSRPSGQLGDESRRGDVGVGEGRRAEVEDLAAGKRPASGRRDDDRDPPATR